MEQLNFLTPERQQFFVDFYNKYHKNYITGCINRTRKVITGLDYDAPRDSKGNYQDKKDETPILREDFKQELTILRRLLSNPEFFNGIEDKGTCVIGEKLYIEVALPRKKYATDLIFIPQPFQGSTSNEEYFNRIKSFLKLVHPEFEKIIQHDSGNMD